MLSLLKHVPSSLVGVNPSSETYKRKVREKRTPRDFSTSSLKPKLHRVCQGNLSLTLHYFKRFTKYPPLHFQNMQKHHKRLLNHTRITHTKLEKDQTSVVAQPSLPQTTFSKLQTKPKAPRIDTRSIFNYWKLYNHEGESFHEFPKQFHVQN